MTFLNCVLLFVVLFYVYPLKFLWFSALTGTGQMGVPETRILFVIYGAGYAAVFLVFALLYRHAWKKRDGLELNALERLKTKQSLTDHIAMSLVGLVSVSLALLLPPRWVAAAGYFYSATPGEIWRPVSNFGQAVRLWNRRSLTEGEPA